MTKRKVPRRSGFAGVDGTIIFSGLDHICFRLYATLVWYQFRPHTDMPSATSLGRELGLHARTLITHAPHLVEVGLLAPFDHSTRQATKYPFRLIHSEANRLLNPHLRLPPVSERKPHGEWKNRATGKPMPKPWEDGYQPTAAAITRPVRNAPRRTRRPHSEPSTADAQQSDLTRCTSDRAPLP